MDNVVKVNIYGQEIMVRGHAREETISNVAKFVDEKITEVQNTLGKNQPPLRIAILAAMNITDELFTYKKEKQKFVDKVEAKTLAITEFIENRIHDIEESKK